MSTLLYVTVGGMAGLFLFLAAILPGIVVIGWLCPGIVGADDRPRLSDISMFFAAPAMVAIVTMIAATILVILG